MLLLHFAGQIWSSCGPQNRAAAQTFGSMRFISVHKGDLMNKSIVVKLAAAALVVGLAGCTDLKPLQAEVDTLKQQVGQLRTDVDAAKASADAASRAASAAQSAANQASHGGERRPEHGQPGAVCGSGGAVFVRCDQRED